MLSRFRDWMDTSCPTAWPRRAPTVQSSLPPSMVNGSKWKWRMALRWVIRSMSWSESPPRLSLSFSGAVGQVESEWG